MTDHDALYHAVLAHPEDDTPRLVYADWLEEHGRAEEAEFIRIHCRLALESPGVPDYSDLLDREEDLRLWLQTHVPEPKIKLRAGLKLAGGSSRWARIGTALFLEFDGYNRPGLKAMRALAAAVEKAFAILPTRWLVIRFVTIEQLAELLKEPVLGRLRELTIQLGTESELRDDAAGLIAASPRLNNLRGLGLLFEFGDAGAAALADSPALARLEWLAVKPAGLSPAAIRSLGGGARSRTLESLFLDDGLPAESFAALCRLDSFVRLYRLSLEGNNCSRNAWEAFAQSRSFPALRVLSANESDMSGGRLATLVQAEWLRLAGFYLDRSAIGADGANTLAQAAWLGSLRWLNLSYNNLGPSGMAALARCRKLAALRHLDLSHNDLGIAGLRALAANPALSGLTALLLNGAQQQSRAINPADFRDFLTNLNMPRLRQLDLSGRYIGPRTTRLLAGDKFASLTRLGLASCKLTGTTVAELLAAPALQNLIDLDLSDNRLGTGLGPLTDRRVMPRLSRCLLTGNRIPADLARKLARRPGVTT